MAWRIHDNVIRGEVDNRERGVVRGRIWLDGVAEPVALDLKGNAMADLAGCLLVFENPGKTIPMRKDARLAPVQEGAIGDLTASRKVRVFDLPLEEAYARLKKKLPVPEHMANSLYLEWFSEANGRVVVESADYKLTVTVPAWRLTPEDEEKRAQDAAQEFTGFMQKVSEALAAEQEPSADTSEQSDKDGPDRAFSDSNADNDALWDADIPDDVPPLEPDPATEGVDWVRCEDGDIAHPLSHRALEGCLALMGKYKSLGLDDTEDEDLVNLLSEYQTASAKLAGALDGLAYGRDLTDGQFIAGHLKRALNHLESAQAALKKVVPGSPLPPDVVESTRLELAALRQEALRLVEEFSGQP